MPKTWWYENGNGYCKRGANRVFPPDIVLSEHGIKLCKIHGSQIRTVPKTNRYKAKYRVQNNGKNRANSTHNNQTLAYQKT